MAITNAMIIEHAQRQLLAEGKIQPTGRMIKIETDNGTIAIPEAEAIHTFAHWKSLGFKVRKGEHAITRLTIWKYGNRHPDEEADPEETPSGYCFHKEACFFAAHQVEPISAPETQRKPA